MKKQGEYRSFELHELAPGVFAACGRPGRGAVSNAGIIDLGGQTVVFDTFMTHLAGRELRDAAVDLTGREPEYVVNSHGHSDHWCGNQAFRPRAAILSTPKTQELMRQVIGEWMEAAIADPQLIQADIDDLEQRSKTVHGGPLRDALMNTLSNRRIFLESLADFHPTPATTTYQTSTEISGTQRTVQLHEVAGGHTSSDTYAVLPQEKIAFLGDLAFFSSHPFLPNSDPVGWSAALESIAQKGLDTIVPGHGPIGSTDDLLVVRQYLTDHTRMAGQVVSDGGSEDDAAVVPIPAAYTRWTDGITRFEVNMRFLYRKLSQTHESH